MEVLNEEIKKERHTGCEIVQLVLFPHQVSGHHCLFIYDDTKLCKPLDEQEHSFYQHIPESLKDYIPEYYGIVKVYFHESHEGITCFALPHDCACIQDANRLESWFHGLSNEKNGSNIRLSNSEAEHAILLASSKYTSDVSENWLPIMKNRLISHLKKKKEDSRVEKFMLLEDVTRKFKFPCVIDLKMGTRGFGDNDTKEKRERKQERVNQSTSGSLGVRLCGMQVYNLQTNKYVFTDKYKGRTYTIDDFRNCIRNFIFNGTDHRTEIIQAIVDRLKLLLDNLQTIDSYRFYCSSLLVMYDGNISSEPRVEVRIIDFSNSVVKGQESNHHVGPDKGFILGVTSLIDIFTTIGEKLRDTS